MIGIGTCLLFLIATSTFAGPVTTGSVVREMIDLHRLTMFAYRGYETVQFERISDFVGQEETEWTIPAEAEVRGSIGLGTTRRPC